MNSNRAVTLKVYRISLLSGGRAQTLSSIENVFILIFSAGFKRMGAKGRHFHGRLPKSEVRILVEEWREHLINYPKALLIMFLL